MIVKASTKFTSTGTKNKFQNESFSVVTADITETVGGITSTSRSTVQRYYDPLAQTFLLPSETQDMLITSVDLFFAKKPTSYHVVTCQIRNVVNGYPGQTVIASKQLSSSYVNASSTSLVATNFNFDELVELKAGVEYCIVVLAPSTNDYEVWVSRMGDKELNKTNIVSVQPSLGTLFKSQNGSTWTPDQYEDLTFQLYRASFDISSHGDILLVNRPIVSKTLNRNALISVAGSTKVRVNHINHGLVTGSYVTLSGVSGNLNGFTNISSSMSYHLQISDVDYESYIVDFADIATSGTATISGPFGGSSVRAIPNVQFGIMAPSIDIKTYTNTDYTLSAKVTDANYQLSNEYYVLNNELLELPGSHFIANSKNEELLMGNSKSFNLRLTMTSNNSYLSPILNRNSSYVDLKKYIINDPTYQDYDTANMNLFDEINLGDTVEVDFDYNQDDPALSWLQISGTAYTNYVQSFSRCHIGKYLYVKNDAATTLNKNLVMLITSTEKTDTYYRIYVQPTEYGTNDIMIDESGKTATLILKDRYIDEITPEGSTAYSTYVSKQINLAIPATVLRCTFDAAIPNDTSLEVWYRSGLSNEFTSLSSKRWTKLVTDAQYNYGDAFIEYIFENSVLPVFDQVQIKIVFRSSDISKSPKVKNLRVLSLA